MDVTIKSRTPKPSEPETVVTEPLIAVLGHPIAGNPSQFALERAFESLQRDWRVISFDVEPDDLHVALSGLDVLGINGILLGTELAEHAARWFNEQTRESTSAKQTAEQQVSQSTRIDCFYRAVQETNVATLLATDAQSDWLAEQIEAYFDEHDSGIPPQVCLIGETTLHIGKWMSEKRSDVKIVQLRDESEQFCADSIAGSSVFLIGNQKPDANLLDWDDWLVSPESSLVFDFTDGYDTLDRLLESGRNVVTSQQCYAGVLSKCINQWLGECPPIEVIQDAMEEYMAV
ncbi:hypothetical protein Q31b_56490 [Novipirellula aureliae]|uniref:Shikimate 5-dehydrogenase n=1 Tax=Novipirellula aureliae TaxID=2527966 RepID=A0A5C6DBU2_9BACT|nr:hypothetical protein [Novipirellula aureliae]TWU34178.1 hypothetical protein Q31b_56490 [Novipirellula aureliae]